MYERNRTGGWTFQDHNTTCYGTQHRKKYNRQYLCFLYTECGAVCSSNIAGADTSLQTTVVSRRVKSCLRQAPASAVRAARVKHHIIHTRQFHLNKRTTQQYYCSAVRFDHVKRAAVGCCTALNCTGIQYNSGLYAREVFYPYTKSSRGSKAVSARRVTLALYVKLLEKIVTPVNNFLCAGLSSSTTSMITVMLCDCNAH